MCNKIKQKLTDYLKLYLIFEIDYLKVPIDFFLSSVFDAGLKSIQLRCKNKSVKERYEIGLIIKKHIRNRDVLFIVNDRVDLAVLLHADGCHVGQSDLPVIPVKKHFNHMFLGYSCHNSEDIIFAKKNNIDYIGLGSVFPTNTKTDVEKVLGLEELRNLAEVASDLPSVAIGGINISNLPEISHFKLDGYAVSSAICSADNPGKIVKEMLNIINRNE
jgi:thiamine-phosphate pyrophosphorylase